MSNYQVENQWGGDESPWHEGGIWVLGNRPDQTIDAINIKAAEGSDNLEGTMQYSGEGPIGFKGIHVEGNFYEVQNQWGGDAGDWHPAGTWTIGYRTEQRVVELDVKADGDQGNLLGNMTYNGEGPIGFKGTVLPID